MVGTGVNSDVIGSDMLASGQTLEAHSGPPHVRDKRQARR